MSDKFVFSHVHMNDWGLELFNLTVDHGLLDITFHGTVITLYGFLEALNDAHVYVALEEGELVGFSWINMFTGKAAAVHVCLFPTARDKQGLGRAFFKYVLCTQDEQGEYYRDCLIGLVPDNYHHVRDFVRRIGMRSAGYVPHAVEAGRGSVNLLIYTITREDIEEGDNRE